MEHVVFFPGPDAAPAFRRFPSLEEAVRFVEHLRNAEDVSEVSVHALVAVPLAFRAYYKVEVPAAEAAVVTELPVAEAPLVAEVPVAEVPAPSEPLLEVVSDPDVDPLDAEVAEMADEAQPVLVPVPDADGEPTTNGKRSLGFFAH